ncbi:MAG TPA: prolyl oligopeptidase family serine peptidase [Terracidiphilus sp.]|nr:prolyl oligopeptidase family serine peptidase [Terracidiphilus sp.]
MLLQNGTAACLTSSSTTFKGMPRLLILHGSQDDNVPIANAKQLMQLCEMRHFDREGHIFTDQGHGFLPPAYPEFLVALPHRQSRQAYA